MKVIFLKHHLKWKPGDVVELDDGISNYLLLTRVVTIETPTDEELENSLTKKLKSAKKKK